MTAKPRPAHLLFFPLAAAWAVLALPASVYAMQTGAPWLTGLATTAGHGHEMLFGFALAVAAGYLINRITRTRLAALAGLWLLARITYVAQPEGIAATVTNIAFAVTVAALAAPQFLRAAKKLRNKLFGPALIAIAIIVTAFHAVVVIALPGPTPSTLLHEGVLLFALIMFFMGGRIIAPAVAGHIQRTGKQLDARVQPRLEGATMVLFLAALVLLPLPAVQPAAALVICAAGLAIVIRAVRWRLWWCTARPDLLGLGIGYLWLGAGLILMGAALVLDDWRLTDALHGVTVGALGTLTISVMARIRLLWAKHDPGEATGIPVAVGLVAVAALARVAAGWWPGGIWTAYWVAAGAWAGAYLLLIRLLVRTTGERRKRIGV